MDHSPRPSAAHRAAEEIFPLPLLPKLLGGGRVREVQRKRQAAERVIEAYCLDRAVGVKALHAMTEEARHLALAGRAVSPDMAGAIAALQHALGVD